MFLSEYLIFSNHLNYSLQCYVIYFGWLVSIEIDVYIVGQEVDPAFGYKNPEIMKSYVTIVKRCERELLCKLSELKCRLEVDKLIACGFVGEDFSKCIIRKYTQRHYTQQKFNLIRDENEG